MTAEQIVQHLPEGTDWNDQTVRTIINRLMKKKALGYQKSGRSCLYYPLISEKECVRGEPFFFKPGLQWSRRQQKYFAHVPAYGTLRLK